MIVKENILFKTIQEITVNIRQTNFINKNKENICII